MVEQFGALGCFGDARRAAVGTELLERVTATGSLVIRKLGATRAGELAIHRFLSAPSVTCKEMLGTLAGRTLAAAAGRRIVVAQDTTEINFSGREANRRGLGPAGDGVSAGFFIHPLVAIDSETEAVLGLLDAHIWTRDDAIEAAPRRQRAIEDKESIRWLRGVERAGELLTEAASVVIVGDRENDIYSCFARWPAGVDLIVRAAQDRTTEHVREGFGRRRVAVRQRGGLARTEADAGQACPCEGGGWHHAGSAIGAGLRRSPCEPARSRSSGRAMDLPRPTRRRCR
jgi:hypothetical protein